MAYPESWQEVAILTIKNGSTKTNFALLTESFEVNNGEKAVEGLATVSGGRIMKWTPEGDTEVTCKIVPVGVGKSNDTTADGFWGLFQPGAGTTDPIMASSSKTRTLYSVAIMWTSSALADAFTSSATSAAATRFVMKNAYITKLTHSFGTSDGLMADMTLKCGAYDKSGNPNIVWDSASGAGAALNVLT
jgi:hypothetical protein